MTKTRVTKTELMAAVIHGGQHECFAHSDLGMFDVTTMRVWLATEPRGPYIQKVFLDQIIPHIRESRVYEEDRARELSEDSWRHDPGIMVVTKEDTGDGPTVAMIDGHHRALRREMEGADFMRFWFVPFALAIRPAPGWIANPFVEWGDDVVDGKIVRKTP